MRAHWILPNRDQRDDVLASDGKNVRPLRELLDPKLRPDGFSHGVPTELLEKCGPKNYSDILFAQRFAHWDGDERLFSISTVAGLDASQRVVYLGLLFVLGPDERPAFDVSYSVLPKADQRHAKALIDRLTAHDRDAWVQSVFDVLELPAEVDPATNVALERSVVPFHSPYVLGRRGALIKKVSNRRKVGMSALVLLILFAFLSAWLTAHARHCSLPQHATNAGVAWHSD